MSIATGVTIFRLFLALLSFYACLSSNLVLQVAAVYLYLFSALLDILDGYLARKLKHESAVGAVLDPTVDKIQTLPPFLYFAWFGLYSFWWVVPIVIRELVITAIRFVKMKQGVALASEKSGKIKTLSQHIAIVASYFFYLAHQYHFEVPTSSPFWAVLKGTTYFYLSIAAILTIYSGLSFCWKNRSIIFAHG